MEETLSPPRARRWLSMSTVLRPVLSSARFYVYLCCTLLALVTAFHLGKEMLWDTMDYHLYAGFSALHDRFGVDYFAAAWQAYLNPYVYAPFYVLATSGLSALQVALILAAVQSGIIWLTYEMATGIASSWPSRTRLAVGVLAAVLAFANPVLINEVGSSFADITTAEVVLGGWLLLMTAIRAPGATKVVFAGALLGTATALKLTNAMYAVAAAPMFLFMSGGWRIKLRLSALYVSAVVAAFLLLSAPWSLKLLRHFGNPFFPLLNGVFRSPYFTTGPLVDYRFIPTSIRSALLLPFTMIVPRSMVHVEWAAPDLRYALLLVAAALLLAIRIHRFFRASVAELAVVHEEHSLGRSCGALGCSFATAWILWLMASANSRYFIPMACVAAVLGIVLVFRALCRYTKVRNYVVLAAFAAQFYQLHFGAQYHAPLPWTGKPWFDVSVPKPIASQPALYFSVGPQSNSFVVPYLASGSGFINLEGVYTLGPDGPNGRRVEDLEKRFAPNLRVLVRDNRTDAAHQSSIPFLGSLNDALEPFMLHVNVGDCSRILVRGIAPLAVVTTVGAPAVQQTYTSGNFYKGYFVTCRLVPYDGSMVALLEDKRAADTALDHLEEACPALFQPRGMTTYILGDKRGSYIYVRRYPNTDVAAWVSRKWVRFQRLIDGGEEQYAGPESAWEKRPLRVTCGRRTGNGDFLKVLQPFK